MDPASQTAKLQQVAQKQSRSYIKVCYNYQKIQGITGHATFASHLLISFNNLALFAKLHFCCIVGYSNSIVYNILLPEAEAKFRAQLRFAYTRPIRSTANRHSITARL